MNNQTNLAATVQTSQAFSGIKPDYIAKAETELAKPGAVNEITRLVPPAVCDQVLSRLAVETPEIGKERAPQAVALLLSGYPQATLRTRDDGQAFDFQSYARTIGKTIAKFPEYAVLGMIECKPWAHPHLPSEPEIKTALTDEVTRRAVIISNAKAHKRESIRRDNEAAEAERIANGRGATEAERKLQISNILARFNRMDGEAA